MSVEVFLPMNFQAKTLALIFGLTLRQAFYQCGHPVPTDKLQAVIRLWCGADDYVSALAAGGPRYDLAGNAAGEVTREQQSDARRHRAKAAAALQEAPVANGLAPS